MRRGLRRPYRLVRVVARPSCLGVLTGMRVARASRAGVRAHIRARRSGAVLLETLRRAAFALAAGLSCVSSEGFRRDGVRGMHMRRAERGRR